MSANLKNVAAATGLEKISFHSKERQWQKKCSNYHIIALILLASNVMPKIHHPRFQQYLK